MGLALDALQQVQAILPTLRSRYMPLGNITGMSDEERAQLIAVLEKTQETEALKGKAFAGP